MCLVYHPPKYVSLYLKNACDGEPSGESSAFSYNLIIALVYFIWLLWPWIICEKYLGIYHIFLSMSSWGCFVFTVNVTSTGISSLFFVGCWFFGFLFVWGFCFWFLGVFLPKQCKPCISKLSIDGWEYTGWKQVTSGKDASLFSLG